MKETLLRCAVGFVSILLCITLVSVSIWLVVKLPVFLLMFASIWISALSYFVGKDVLRILGSYKFNKKI